MHKSECPECKTNNLSVSYQSTPGDPDDVCPVGSCSNCSFSF